MTPAVLMLALAVGCGDKDSTDGEDTGTTVGGSTDVYQDVDEDGYTSDVDCDDSNPAVNPSATELCDDIDNDCDGTVDEGLTGAFYVDGDGDGYGDPSALVEACELEDGLSVNPDDCNDDDAAVNPDVIEVCNDIDDDCDLVIDENDAEGAPTWFLDEDGDGFGDTEKTTVACNQPDDYQATDGDCDDESAAIYPGALEVCNDLDDDCDEQIDEDASDAPTWYRDNDGDSYGVDGELVVQCDPPDGYADIPGDCDDYNGEINPGAEEICDGIDNDCDDSSTEDNLVTFESVDGTMSDVSSYFSGGTYSRPEGWILSADGTFSFCQGTYYTYLELGADITLLGVYGAEDTILSAGDLLSVIEITTDGVDAVIEGLTLRDGLGSGAFLDTPSYDTGGGVYCAANADLVIIDSIITESAADVGGGVYVETCELSLSGTTVSNSAADYGGGIAVLDGDVELSESTVTSNSASYSGGGLYIDGSGDAASGANIVYSLIEDNDALYGGGMALIEGGMGCTGSTGADQGFLDNNASYGGAIFADSPSSLRSMTCDWGDGSDENSPHDIYLNPYGETFDFEDDASFSCSAYSCTES